jgi:hypothetical protein
MLLIDPGRIMHVRPDAAPRPFVLRDFHGDPMRAGTFFTGSALAPEQLLLAITRELTDLSGGGSAGDALPSPVLTDLADWVARARVQVGQGIPATVTLVFRSGQPVSRGFEETVRFASPVVAANFIRQCLGDPPSRTAMDSALACPDAGDARPPTGADDLIPFVASLLSARQLGLIPVDGTANVLRIAWLMRQGPTKGLPPPDPAEAPAAPTSQTSQTAPSTLPEPPAVITPQAQALIDAAKDGTPFCEECARAAAAGLLGG